MANELVLYHGHCRDGFAAAFSHWLCVGRDRAPEKRPAYQPIQYGEEFPEMGGREVVFLDWAPKDSRVTMELATLAKSILLIDHHKSQLDAHEGLMFLAGGRRMLDEHGSWMGGDEMLGVDLRFDLARSGAGMSWDHFVNAASPKYLVAHGLKAGRERPWLIDYVEDRDLWKFELPHSKEVNAYIQSLPANGPEDFGTWLDVLKRGAGHAAEIGRELVALQQTYIDMMLDHQQKARLVDGEGNVHENVPCVNAPYWSCSELVGAMAQQNPEGFAFAWFRRGDNKVAYMVRSRGDFDVSVLAKSLGGGGHKNASGFYADDPVHEVMSDA